VNSSHHQCVDTLGAELTVAATAEEPIIEAIQWKNTNENPFYLGVQVRLKYFILFFIIITLFSGIQNEWLIKQVHFHLIFVKHF
jgi:hypothetical protein